MDGHASSCPGDLASVCEPDLSCSVGAGEVSTRTQKHLSLSWKTQLRRLQTRVWEDVFLFLEPEDSTLQVDPTPSGEGWEGNKCGF